MLLEASVNKHLHGPKQHAPLTLVARDRRATLLDLSVTADVELNKVDELVDWPLREATRSGWISAVDRLIKSGADPNTREGRKISPVLS
jgi:hypothetical protein